ncbi:hypothetical protein [Streptomyces sp. NPDC000880]
MMSQLEQAMQTNTDVIWWTDHDWRMQAYGYYDGIAFDGTDEDGGLAWVVQNNGPVTDAQHAFIDEPHSPDEPGKAMRVAATGADAQWGVSFLWADGGNSFYSTNLTDTTFHIDVLAERVGPDAELVVQLETSYRTATAGRPAGVYVLEYRVGSEAARRLETPLTGVITAPATGDWQTLEMRPLDDIRAFWPDLVAEDSGLARLRFGVRARNNATAQGVFDHLRITRTRDMLNWPVRTQRQLMKRLAKRYPNVTQLLSAEVSMVRHLNVYMENFELYPYPDRGKAPSLIGSVEAAQAMVRWYHERGALVQYNHPPINPAELVASRALGTDLMETADATGGFTVTKDRINLFDVAARNAIFLTSTSQIDDHAGRNWPDMSHLYLTSVWSESKTAPDIISALGAGQAWWHHQRLWPTGQFDLTVGGRRAMGRVMETTAETIPVEIFAENLPAGATVQVVLGVCDRSGATTPSIEKHPFPAEAFAEGPLPFRLEQHGGRYLRLEAYDSEGVLLGFGNPLWLLPKTDDVKVPGRRKLVMNADHLR